MPHSRPRRRSALLCSALLLAAAALGPSPAAGQSQATTGVIRGIVADSAGSPIVGSTITLRNTQTNYVRNASTNERGVYVATLLPLGTYVVSARALGFAEGSRDGIVLRVGQSVEVPFTLARQAVGLSAVTVVAAEPLVDVTRVEAATTLTDEVVSGLPNNGRNYLNLTLLTPNVAVVQGPDGDELSVGGQRGIHNNVSVDGADFNNPFFGEQRGGQRPAFTFNLDAVQELVVVAQGANAEFGRSGGGFVNVITKSGTNDLRGSMHYFGKHDKLSQKFEHESRSVDPDFSQHQFGFTLGGPIRRDRMFFFLAYDQQIYDETKQQNRPSNAAFDSLKAYTDTAFGGALRGDFGSIPRTNDANALLAKFDVILSSAHTASIKYNYTNSKQVNGTFDVDVWGRSANAIEKDFSHAVNGSLSSQLGSTIANEFRFQLSREDRPRPYGGPSVSGSRPFPDTGIDFAQGFRFGMPFFIPIEAHDTRIQVLDNISWSQGNHLFKIGGEWNRTEAKQTFIGFANGRYIFGSVTGFLNYQRFGPRYVECSGGATSTTGTCPAGQSITGPLVFYLQFAPVPPLTTPEQAGTQAIQVDEYSFFAQDTWKPVPNLTLNYGVRWEAQIQPDPITPPDEVFFSPFIGATRLGRKFPSDGTIPSDKTMIQPRLGMAWDVNGDGKQVLRASGGLYYSRIPGLVLASTRTSNGSVGQNIFRASFFNGFGVTPPAYPNLISTTGVLPDHPDVFVTDKDFRNPRTTALSAGYEREIAANWAASLTYNYAKTDFLGRFVNRNDPVFGSPFSRGLPAAANAPTGPADTLNGIGTLTVLESTAKSQYHGVTASVKGKMGDRFDAQLNYTLSYDKSDDDNERDPFSFRYARADRLDREYSWSDRDQRHRVNAWFLLQAPWAIYLNNRVSYYSAQPRSDVCDSPANPFTPRICSDGSIVRRNTLRKENEFFSWDVRVSKPFPTGGRGTLELIVEVFNLTNTDNFRDPAPTPLLFNFDGTIRSGLGDPRQVQAGVRWVF